MQARILACIPSHISLILVQEVNGRIHGFDVSAFNRFSRDTRIVKLSSFEHRKISAPHRVLTINLSVTRSTGTHTAAVTLKSACAGYVDAVVYWYETRMRPGGDSVCLGPGGQDGGAQFAWMVGQVCTQHTQSGQPTRQPLQR